MILQQKYEIISTPVKGCMIRRKWKAREAVVSAERQMLREGGEGEVVPL